jgi:signal transduction histidine kinase
MKRRSTYICQIQKLPFLLLFIIQFVGIEAWSGNVIDSLEILLPKVKDTSKVIVLNELCWQYRFIEPNKAYKYGNAALDLAGEINYKNGMAQSYNDLGILYIDQSDYNQAINYFNNALEIRKELKDQKGIAALYNKLGIVYQKQSLLPSAIENQIKALEIYEALEMDLYAAYCLNNIAIIHQNLGHNDKALLTHKKALKVRQKLNDRNGEAASYGNMANVYLRMADTLNAIQYYEKSILIFEDVNDKVQLSAMLNNLGQLYLGMFNYSQAYELLAKAYEIRAKLEDKKAIASTLLGLGEVYLSREEYQKSKSSYHKALMLAEDCNARVEIMQANLRLAKLHSILNRPDSAYYYQQNYSAVKDSVFDEQLAGLVLEMEAKYETEKNQKEIQLLTSKAEISNLEIKQQRFQITLLFLGLFLILGMASFIIYRNRQKHKAEYQQAIINEKELGLKAVINAQEDERKRIAKDLHDGIGQTLSGLKLSMQGVCVDFKVTENKNYSKLFKLSNVLDDACNEVRNMSHQMMPKQLGELGLVPALEDMLDKALGDTKLKYSFEYFNVAERFNETVEIALYRVCQELINNTIKHAEATEVNIQLFKNKEFLMLVVEDNGVGLSSKSNKDTGIGMLNIRSRIESINGRFEIDNKAEGGTIANIKIPLQINLG